MAWKESDRVSQRLEFVRLASVEGSNISLLCRRFGVSRKLRRPRPPVGRPLFVKM